MKNCVKVVYLKIVAYIKIFFLKRKSRKIFQKSRIAMFKQYPPIEGDVGIGYKDGMMYDYLYKEYV